MRPLKDLLPFSIHDSNQDWERQHRQVDGQVSPELRMEAGAEADPAWMQLPADSLTDEETDLLCADAGRLFESRLAEVEMPARMARFQSPELTSGSGAGFQASGCMADVIQAAERLLEKEAWPSWQALGNAVSALLSFPPDLGRVAAAAALKARRSSAPAS